MKILTVVGARPQFVKAAAVSLEFAASRANGADIDEVLVHTGQHYDPLMSDVFFDELVIPSPGHHLGVGSSNHGEQTGLMMQLLEPLVLDEAPDLVLVYGDANSTLAGALVAAKLHVPVAHVEAGLRSFDRRMPEEINRVLTDHMSDLLLCPSGRAIENLRAEGVTVGVEFTGDVMHGELIRTRDSLGGRNPVAERLGLATEPYVVATMHRASNTDDPARAGAVIEALRRLAAGGQPVVFPVHPRATELVGAFGVCEGVNTIEPLGYRDMVALTAGASAVVTDSGGLQKEAVWLGVPCVTIREQTEWVETVEDGWNVVVGTAMERIVEAVRSAAAPAQPFDRYGGDDGAARVVRSILARFG
jgi:UDP-N-acetylglucosamine 2-epimerase